MEHEEADHLVSLRVSTNSPLTQQKPASDKRDSVHSQSTCEPNIEDDSDADMDVPEERDATDTESLTSGKPAQRSIAAKQKEAPVSECLSPQNQLDKTPAAQLGVLGLAVDRFQTAVTLNAAGEVAKADRVALIRGLERYVQVLDKLASIGSYLDGNVRKLNDSKADAGQSDYLAWLLTELPEHASTKYKGYDDKSAWMGNLWIVWTLEFFVEMFANLHDGMDTSSSVSQAYKKTLYHHHNLLQRGAFTTALKKLPDREMFYKSIQNGAATVDVKKEVAEFVAVGRPLIRYLHSVNETLDYLEANRKLASSFDWTSACKLNGSLFWQGSKRVP